MFSNLIERLPMLLLSLPVIFFSLSVHECCHGYAALKLGDSTARNFGRLTLNPLKHIDPIGLICMVLFHFGWANPVPINTRNFKNPRRDMALSALAGPVSNVLLALVFGGLLRLALLGVTAHYEDDLVGIVGSLMSGGAASVSSGFAIVALLVYMLYLGVIINFSYAVFNLIPVPPLDGSRIFYVVLPPKWYFAVMKYERYIMFGMLALLWIGILDLPLSLAVGGLEKLTFSLFGMDELSTAALQLIQIFVGTSL